MNRLEGTILKNLIHNDEYTRKVLPFIKSEYFSDTIEKLVFSEILEFITKYKVRPSHEALVINFTEKKSLTEPEVRNSIELLNEIEISKNDKVNFSWILENTEKFCQDKAIYNAIMSSVSILDDAKGIRSKGEIPKILSEALGVCFDDTVGHDYMVDSDSRYDSYHHVEQKFRFDLEMFNKITKGGFTRKTLNVFLAGVGVGKSLAMCHMASCFLAQGLNALYITMEMAEERIAERIDANLLNVPLNNLSTMAKSEYERKFDALKNKTHGRLIIKEYPTAAASTLHFRTLLGELLLKKNFKPEVIFVDYLNICASSRIKMGASVNSYTYVKSIAEELRGMAIEFNVPLITATQLTRSGFDNSDPSLTDVSESFGVAASADFMAALITNEELEALNQILVKQLKNRYSDVNYYKKFVVGVDRPKMRLYDVESVAQTNISASGQDVSDSTPNTFDNKFKKDFSTLKI